MTIINIIPDDKFSVNLIKFNNAFRIAGVRHRYVLLRKTDGNPTRGITEIEDLTVEDLCDAINGCDALFIHGYADYTSYILLSTPKHVKVFWFSWGYDIYSPIRINEDEQRLLGLGFSFLPFVAKAALVNMRLFGQATLPFCSSRNRIKELAMRLAWKTILRKRCLALEQIMQNAIRRVDYYSGVFPEEYHLISRNSFFQATRFMYAYVNLESDINIEDVNAYTPQGANIQIGNSGAEYNNHLDVFNALKRLPIRCDRIFVPLSYCGSPRYVKAVIETGRQYFKEKFFSLTQFMPFGEYNKLVKSCGNVIIGSERQHAVGNIEMALWRGAKVYLSKTSLNYSHFKKMGFTVFSIQDDLTDTNLSTRLNRDEVIRNRAILRKIYNTEAYRNMLSDLYSLISSPQSSCNSKC